jgi:very-short-patch-repair endonuclease
MNTGSEAALAALAQSQHGIFTANDFRHLGISDRTARRRRDDGRWIAVVPGIYRLVGSPVTVRMLEEAVVLWLGVESVRLSHSSAARLWGLSSPQHNRAVITVSHGRRVEPPPGVEMHRTRHFPRGFMREGLPVTAVDRTLVDLAQVHTHQDVLDAFTSAIVHRLTTVDRVVRAAAGLHNRTGTGLIRDLAHELSQEFESHIEVELGKALRARGWTHWTPQLRVVGSRGRLLARADFGDPLTKTLLEVDGFAYHGLPEQQQRDKARDRRLGRGGWLTLRFSATEVRDRLEETLDEIAAARSTRLIGRRTANTEVS